MPGAITKGDVDVLIRIPASQFPDIVRTLASHFQVEQASNWTSDFASFGEHVAYSLPVGIQVVALESPADFFLFLHDYFRSHSEALQQYNRLKLMHAHEGPEAYWRAKDAFLSGILAARQSDRRQPEMSREPQDPGAAN